MVLNKYKSSATSIMALQPPPRLHTPPKQNEHVGFIPGNLKENAA